MRLKPIRRSARQRAVVDATVAAYSEWRRECAAVRNAYRSWASARAVDKPLAFVAYTAALDREEGAAKLADLMEHQARGDTEGLEEDMEDLRAAAGLEHRT